jgi:hypothetical protein
MRGQRQLRSRISRSLSSGAHSRDPVAHSGYRFHISNSTSRSRRMIRASFALSLPPSHIRGSRECRVLDAPAASCALGSGVCTRVFTAEAPESSGIPHAMVLTVSSALSPVIGLSCHRHPRDAQHHRELDASVEASGPHGFAVRISAVRYRRLRVHRIPSRVRDDREPPLEWDGTAENKPVIWVR